MTNQREELLTAKELAYILKRHPNYVYRMHSLGFLMIGGRGRLSDALVWLKSNGSPYSVMNCGKLCKCMHSRPMK